MFCFVQLKLSFWSYNIGQAIIGWQTSPIWQTCKKYWKFTKIEVVTYKKATLFQQSNQLILKFNSFLNKTKHRASEKKTEKPLSYRF